MIIKHKNSKIDNNNLYNKFYYYSVSNTSLDNNFLNDLCKKFPKENTKKIYFTELLLLTNSDNFEYILNWLHYHINVIKVDHIVIIDNSLTQINNQHESIKQRFKDKVEIHRITGSVNQAEIYTKFVNNSQSEYVFPIDDDEYIFISDKFKNNLNLFIKNLEISMPGFFKYSFNWHMMFASKINENYDNNFIINNTNTLIKNIKQNTNFVEGYNFIKCIVNTKIWHFYLGEGNDKIHIPFNNILLLNINLQKLLFNKLKDVNYDCLGTVHNPISYDKNSLHHSFNFESNEINIGFFNYTDSLSLNTDACLYHFKYRSFNEWMYKIKNFKLNNISNYYFQNVYNENRFYNVYNYALNNTVIDDRISKLYSSQ